MEKEKPPKKTEDEVSEAQRIEEAVTEQVEEAQKRAPPTDKEMLNTQITI